MRCLQEGRNLTAEGNDLIPGHKDTKVSEATHEAFLAHSELFVFFFVFPYSVHENPVLDSFRVEPFLLLPYSCLSMSTDTVLSQRLG